MPQKHKHKKETHPLKGWKKALRARISNRALAAFGIFTILIVLITGWLAIRFRQERLSADIVNQSVISNTATFKHCSEGDSVDVCDPAQNKFTGTGSSNTVTTQVLPAATLCLNTDYSNASEFGKDRQLTIEVKDSNGSVVDSFSDTSDTTGKSATDEGKHPGITTKLSGGPFTITLKSPGFRPIVLQGILNPLTSCLSSGTFIAGDINSDGKIDLTDLLILNNHRTGKRVDATVAILMKDHPVELRHLLEILNNRKR